jgi:hypothetical protein
MIKKIAPFSYRSVNDYRLKRGIGVCGHMFYSNENQRERMHQCHSGNQHDCLTEPFL